MADKKQNPDAVDESKNSTPEEVTQASAAETKSDGKTASVSPTVADLQRRLKRSKTINFALAAVAVFLLIIAIAQPLSQSNPPVNPEAAVTPDADVEPLPQPTDGPLAERIANKDPNNPMAYGSLDAPVTVIEWTDYRCPFCAKYTKDTMPTLMKEYVDKGLIRYEVRDVSFFGEESTLAAVAARAAGEQGKFAEFFDVLYAAAPESGHPDMPKEKLIGFAQEAGVPDIDKFTADLDRADLKTAVEQSTVNAQQMGINAVPFFVVGGQYFSGAQPLETFQKVFDEEIERAKTADTTEK